DDGAPGRIGQRAERAVEPVIIGNHMVTNMARGDVAVNVIFVWAFAVQAGVPAPAIPMLLGARALGADQGRDPAPGAPGGQPGARSRRGVRVDDRPRRASEHGGGPAWA